MKGQSFAQSTSFAGSTFQWWFGDSHTAPPEHDVTIQWKRGSIEGCACTHVTKFKVHYKL